MTTKALNSVTQSWYESHEQLLGFIISKVQNVADAEDILQDVFLKAMNKADALAEDTNLNAWLYVVTRNAINDYFRSKSKTHSEELKPELVYQEDEIYQNEFCCLEPHINELDEKYREVIYLSEIKGMKHQSIADQLGLSLSAIKSRVVRGREQLKEKFISCCHYHVNEDGKLSGDPDCHRPDCNH